MAHPATVIVKKRNKIDRDAIYTLSSGVRVRFHPVSQLEMQEIASLVPEPQVPIWKDPDTNREVPNSSDPTYRQAVIEANTKRGTLAVESMLLGVELIDGLPADEIWLPKLRFKEKRGIINLSDFDLADPIDKEFVYKKHCAVLTDDDWELLGIMVGTLKEATDKAGNTFQGDEERDTDREAPTQEGQQST